LRNLERFINKIWKYLDISFATICVSGNYDKYHVWHFWHEMVFGLEVLFWILLNYIYKDIK